MNAKHAMNMQCRRMNMNASATLGNHWLLHTPLMLMMKRHKPTKPKSVYLTAQTKAVVTCSQRHLLHLAVRPSKQHTPLQQHRHPCKQRHVQCCCMSMSELQCHECIICKPCKSTMTMYSWPGPQMLCNTPNGATGKKAGIQCVAAVTPTGSRLTAPHRLPPPLSHQCMSCAAVKAL